MLAEDGVGKHRIAPRADSKMRLKLSAIAGRAAADTLEIDRLDRSERDCASGVSPMGRMVGRMEGTLVAY